MSSKQALEAYSHVQNKYFLLKQQNNFLVLFEFSYKNVIQLPMENLE
jgi:hypothetical protein